MKKGSEKRRGARKMLDSFHGNDVLLGREDQLIGCGNTRLDYSVKHGDNCNTRLHEWIQARKDRYQGARNNAEKRRIVGEVMELVKSQNPPGRFLLQQDDKQWAIASEDKAKLVTRTLLDQAEIAAVICRLNCTAPNHYLSYSPGTSYPPGTTTLMQENQQEDDVVESGEEKCKAAQDSSSAENQGDVQTQNETPTMRAVRQGDKAFYESFLTAGGGDDDSSLAEDDEEEKQRYTGLYYHVIAQDSDDDGSLGEDDDEEKQRYANLYNHVIGMEPEQKTEQMQEAAKEVVVAENTQHEEPEDEFSKKLRQARRQAAQDMKLEALKKTGETQSKRAEAREKDYKALQAEVDGRQAKTKSDLQAFAKDSQERAAVTQEVLKKPPPLPAAELPPRTTDNDPHAYERFSPGKVVTAADLHKNAGTVLPTLYKGELLKGIGWEMDKNGKIVKISTPIWNLIKMPRDVEVSNFNDRKDKEYEYSVQGSIDFGLQTMLSWGLSAALDTTNAVSSSFFGWTSSNASATSMRDSTNLGMANQFNVGAQASRACSRLDVKVSRFMVSLPDKAKLELSEAALDHLMVIFNLIEQLEEKLCPKKEPSIATRRFFINFGIYIRGGPFTLGSTYHVRTLSDEVSAHFLGEAKKAASIRTQNVFAEASSDDFNLSGVLSQAAPQAMDGSFMGNVFNITNATAPSVKTGNSRTTAEMEDERETMRTESGAQVQATRTSVETISKGGAPVKSIPAWIRSLDNVNLLAPIDCGDLLIPVWELVEQDPGLEERGLTRENRKALAKVLKDEASLSNRNCQCVECLKVCFPHHLEEHTRSCGEEHIGESLFVNETVQLLRKGYVLGFDDIERVQQGDQAELKLQFFLTKTAPCPSCKQEIPAYRYAVHHRACCQDNGYYSRESEGTIIIGRTEYDVAKEYKGPDVHPNYYQKFQLGWKWTIVTKHAKEELEWKLPVDEFELLARDLEKSGQESDLCTGRALLRQLEGRSEEQSCDVDDESDDDECAKSSKARAQESVPARTRAQAHPEPHHSPQPNTLPNTLPTQTEAQTRATQVDVSTMAAAVAAAVAVAVVVVGVFAAFAGGGRDGGGGGVIEKAQKKKKEHKEKKQEPKPEPEVESSSIQWYQGQVLEDGPALLDL